MKLIKTITLLSMAIFMAASCSETDENPVGEFSKGIFVVNEGNFSDANGSIGFYHESNKVATQDIFEKANGTAVGGLIQSIYFYDDRAFIIDQLGNKIYVVNAGTFELITTIEDGLSTPRYMVVAQGKAYITNWGQFDANYNLPDSYVSVFDLTTYEEEATIKTDNGSEGLFSFGGMVYVANSYSNTIDIIDPASTQVESQIEVAAGPLSFVEDKNNKVWLLSSSYINGSALSQIDLATEEVIKTFKVGDSAKSLQINSSGEELYYLSAPYGVEASVYKLAITANENSTTPVLTGPNLYGLGVHPTSGLLYIANNNGFQGNGTILIYDEGELLDNFASGVGPNGFAFR